MLERLGADSDVWRCMNL